MTARPHSSTGGAPESGPDSDSPGRAKTGATLVIDALIRHGITTVFGVPGDTGVSLYDAFYHRQTEITHVLARDERHAAAMADAFARTSNSVGTVEVSSGGGVSYVIGGLGEAYAASVPLLVITSDIHSASRGTGALTEIDQAAMFAAVTKWRAVAQSAAEIPGLIAEAISAATSGRPAPVAIIIPEELLDETTESWVSPPALPSKLGLGLRAEADHARLQLAVEKLDGAQRPVIIAGSGIHLSEAWSSLEKLAEHGAIPVATTIHGKGAISDASPWSLGVVGANGAREYANDYVAKSDVVLLVGTRANATDTNSWTGPRHDHPDVISINVTDHPIAKNFPNAVLLMGDATTVLDQICHAIQPADESRRAELVAMIAESVAAWAPSYPTGDESVGTTGHLEPRHVVQVAHRVLAESCMVIADPGTPTPNVAAYWDVRVAGRSVIMPRGHGPMGYAIPGAVGVAMARPESSVLSFTADGSFAMACGELETVARFQLPIVFIQFTNHTLGWIKMLQHLYHDGRYFGVDPGPIDAVAVAAACGVRGVSISSLSQLEEELSKFVRDPQPLYLNVDVPDLMESTPPVAPWQAALTGDSTRPVY